MESLLLPIINHISQSFPEIPYVDEDYGQLEAIDNDNVDTYPVVFPCVLINTDSVDWSSLSAKSQKGNAHICVRLCIDCYDDTHFASGTTEKIKERSELVHSLHAALQTFRPLSVGALVRTKSKFYTWSHGIKVYELYYDIDVDDIITPANGKTLVKPSISPYRRT